VSDIQAIVKKLCEAGAAAIHRYAKVSGENPFDDMPEHFLQAFILDHLGDEVTLTIETGFSKLILWNDHARRRQGVPPLRETEKAELIAAAQNIGLPRIDIVVFDEAHPDQAKTDQAILALVELKKGAWAIDNDRKKLRQILPHVDTCKYGVVAGACKQSEMATYQSIAESTGDIWFQSNVPPLHFGKESYVFCARLFGKFDQPASYT
jgi:hypothetical protein